MKFTNSVETLPSPTPNLLVLPANTVKIHKIKSFEAFLKMKPDFTRLRKAIIIDDKIVAENTPLQY